MREGPSMSEYRNFSPQWWVDPYLERDMMFYDRRLYEDYERERDILWEREMSIRKNLPESEIRSGLLTVDTNEMKKVFAK